MASGKGSSDEVLCGLHTEDEAEHNNHNTIQSQITGLFTSKTPASFQAVALGVIKVAVEVKLTQR